MFTEFYPYAYVNMDFRVNMIIIICIVDFTQPYEIYTLCSQEKMTSSLKTNYSMLHLTPDISKGLNI